MRFFSLLAPFALLGVSAAFAADPSPTASPTPEAAAAEGFDLPVPMGIPVKGIKIPHRNEEGKLVMTIEADVAKKIDETHVEMENMKIESVDDEGKTILITLPQSVFDLETRILTGESNAFIQRDDFEITGDAVEFNTKTRHATLRGKIRMVIQSASIEQ